MHKTGGEKGKEMDRREFDDRRRIGTVKASVSLYGERILQGSLSLQKPVIDLPESSSRVRELHRARSDMARYRESRRAAESLRASAESELFDAKRTVKDLAKHIDDVNDRLRTQMRGLETLRRPSKREEKAVRSDDGDKYADVMRELENVKQEMSRLKLDVASVLDEKERAERENEGSSSKMMSYSSSVDALRKEIDEANEEQVLVELARMEALKEFAEIEAQRQKEASEFSSSMEEKWKIMADASQEISRSKELESKFAMTISDIDVLQNELKALREMEKKVKRNESLRHDGGTSERARSSEGSSLLKSVTDELEAAKQELTSIREEGFQFMASMDIIRNELMHVTQETALLKSVEDKANLTVRNLNSKLLRAKTKLETVTAAEEKAKSIVSNLCLTLDQLKTEAEVAKKEKALIAEETASIVEETQKTEAEIDSTEEILASAMQDLEAVKSSEALALEHLQTLTESIMTRRASTSQHSSIITISKFEYEYLTGRAVGAEEIADKKVAAAQAWIEALKASEREITMRIEATQRDTKQRRLEEEQEVYRTKRSQSGQKREKRTDAGNLQLALPKKSAKASDSFTPSRRGKTRVSASPSIRTTPRSTPRSTPFAIRKRQKVIPNLARFFAGKKGIGKAQ